MLLDGGEEGGRWVTVGVRGPHAHDHRLRFENVEDHLIRIWIRSQRTAVMRPPDDSAGRNGAGQSLPGGELGIASDHEDVGSYRQHDNAAREVGVGSSDGGQDLGVGRS